MAGVLDSLRHQTLADFEVIVVDNGSTDGSLDYLRRQEDIRVVENGANLGFSKAVNRAAKVAHGQYYVLLNNDMELEPNWLAELIKPFGIDERIAFTSSKILQFADRSMIDEAGHDWSIWGVSLPRGYNGKDDGQFEQPTDTLVASGGASAFRAGIWQELGGLDEDFFFYYEDSDFCFRAVLRGAVGRYVPTAVAYHHGAGSSGRMSAFTYTNITRNLLIVIFRDWPLGVVVPALPKIMFHQLRLFAGSVKDGWFGSYLNGTLQFWLYLPRLITKRRQIQKSRTISAAEFKLKLRPEYPFPTRILK